MSLPLPLQQAANFFSESIIVYDVVSTVAGGRTVQTQEPDRVIRGVIQPITDPMDIGEDGSIASGVFRLDTTAVLFIIDSTQDTEEFKQTYVRYSDDIWRITQKFDLAIKAQGYNRYALSKGQEIGGL